ncbi:MAG: S8 family serine peptidase [Bacteroidota bacterium]
MKNSKRIYWGIFLVVLLCLVGIGCFNDKTPNTPISYNPNFPADSQLIVWMAPEADTAKFKDWLKNLKDNNSTVNYNYCDQCDSSLVVLSGPNLVTAVSGALASGGSRGGSGGPSGGGTLYYWCYNFDISISDSLYETSKKDTVKIDEIRYLDPKPVTIAVFDTGIDSAMLTDASYTYNSPNLSCLGPQANKGWNFIARNNATNDDYFSPGHGSNVSRIILKQIQQLGKNPVKILPVKIHSKEGKGNLFDALCGIAYAEKSGAVIINASFGFYSPRVQERTVDSAALLFKEFTKKHLTNNKILMVAAAGNTSDAQQIAAINFISRNLDTMNFYPASFAGDPEMQNVIAVTTVKESGDGSRVSPRQNFSGNVVDIGVVSNNIIMPGDSIYLIKNPRLANSMLEGSSYAAPVVAGYIGGNYNELRSKIDSNEFNKQNIFDTLGIRENATLTPYVKAGKVIKQ